MINWLRESKIAAVIFAFLRIYLGWNWMTSGWGKITGGFDASGYLNNAVANPVNKAGEVIYPTYTAFIEAVALPNVKLFNVLVPWGELLVGLGLVVGALTATAAFFGLVMNFMFLFAGTISTNPWMVLIGGLIFIAGANAGKFGVDFYLMPYLKNLINQWKANRTGAGGTAGKGAADEEGNTAHA
ncbi:DoxX family membrane protein [Paenibacillus senegalensis]|uniref:DoxX family membrane protein n=1 Tax=Paenibacillus senegalensis TaxID=1465766 RepID=UPI0005AB5944|nr:DoxX family protein [Paenibacillus senegalensis]